MPNSDPARTGALYPIPFSRAVLMQLPALGSRYPTYPVLPTPCSTSCLSTVKLQQRRHPSLTCHKARLSFITQPSLPTTCPAPMAGTTLTHIPPEQRPSTNLCAHRRWISRLLQTLSGLPCTNARSWEGCTSAPGFPAPCSASSQGLPSVPSLPLHPKPLLHFLSRPHTCFGCLCVPILFPRLLPAALSALCLLFPHSQTPLRFLLQVPGSFPLCHHPAFSSYHSTLLSGQGPHTTF